MIVVVWSWMEGGCFLNMVSFLQVVGYLISAIATYWQDSMHYLNLAVVFYCILLIYGLDSCCILPKTVVF